MNYRKALPFWSPGFPDENSTVITSSSASCLVKQNFVMKANNTLAKYKMVKEGKTTAQSETIEVVSTFVNTTECQVID